MPEVDKIWSVWRFEMCFMMWGI